MSKKAHFVFLGRGRGWEGETGLLDVETTSLKTVFNIACRLTIFRLKERYSEAFNYNEWINEGYFSAQRLVNIISACFSSFYNQVVRTKIFVPSRSSVSVEEERQESVQNEKTTFDINLAGIFNQFARLLRWRHKDWILWDKSEVWFWLFFAFLIDCQHLMLDNFLNPSSVAKKLFHARS